MSLLQALFLNELDNFLLVGAILRSTGSMFPAATRKLIFHRLAHLIRFLLKPVCTLLHFVPVQFNI
jgi:hypothetical protein